MAPASAMADSLGDGGPYARRPRALAVAARGSGHIYVRADVVMLIVSISGGIVAVTD